MKTEEGRQKKGDRRRETEDGRQKIEDRRRETEDRSSVVEPEPAFLAGAGAMKKGGGSGSSSRSSYDPMFEEKIEQKC